ncbi:MAG: hypothetical protein ACRBB3_01180 [Alphaproteobacteria bacterium]
MSTVSGSSLAQHLTGLEIEGLFKKTEELYTQDVLDRDEIIRLTKLHTTDDALVEHEMKSNKGPRIITKTLTRDEVIADMENKKDKTYDTSLRRTITDISYSDDKVSATVEYTALYIATVELSEEERSLPEYLGQTVLPFKSLSACSENFKLVDDVLKSTLLECKTEILYGKARAIK